MSLSLSKFEDKDMKIKYIVVLLLLFFVQNVFSARQEFFKGEARENGKIVYLESHEVTFDDKNNVLEAKTTYFDPDEKAIAALSSNFRQSLSLPEHVFEDYRTKGQYGIRRSDNKIILFNKDDGKPETTKVLESNSDKDRVQVGCQGFNYFLKGKIDSLRDQKSLPVLFMIPGDLSTYKFVLNYVRENADQTVEFSVKIENVFLRLFAPELEFRYDQKKQRIVWYKGISNIKSNDNKPMNVVIEYKYE